MNGAGPGGRRAWSARFAALAGVAAIAVACGRAGPESGASEVSVGRTGSGTVPADPLPVTPVTAHGEGDGDGARADGAAGMAGGGEVAGAEAASADALDSGFDAYAVPDDAAETVSPERCAAACDNAKRVTLNELPADLAPSMRDAIEHAMTRECPRRCVERASVSAVRCIESARTALELAACPR